MIRTNLVYVHMYSLCSVQLINKSLWR